MDTEFRAAGLHYILKRTEVWGEVERCNHQILR
jgi:hypothetical protein